MSVASSTFRALYVGDTHATVPELPDCRALAALVFETAAAHAVDAVVFLGDQYHTHAVMHVEVMNFWLGVFDRLVWQAGREVIALVGNHDRPGVDGSNAHAMQAHDRFIKVIAHPEHYRGIDWVPFMPDNAAFLEACSKGNPDSLLVCHQTFDGGIYDNGFYAKDGVDPNLVPQQRILSGHIHAPQEFGKVWYLGAPRWRTASDANVDRHIWVVDHVDGRIVSKTSVATAPACRRIWDLKDTPDAQFDPAGYDVLKDDVRVSIEGPAEWVDARKKVLIGSGVRVRTVKTGGIRQTVRESEGIDRAFGKYVEAFVPPLHTPKPALEALVRARLT